MTNKLTFLLLVLALTFSACSGKTVEEQVEEEVAGEVQVEEEESSDVLVDENLSALEKDAIESAKLICKTRGLSVRLVDGGEKAIKDLEVFQNENQFVLRELFESYPIHTEDGALFMERVNFHLENCEYNP